MAVLQEYALKESASNQTDFQIIPDVWRSRATPVSVTNIENAPRMGRWLHQVLSGFDVEPSDALFGNLEFLSAADRFSAQLMERVRLVTPMLVTSVRDIHGSSRDGSHDFKNMLRDIISWLGITYDELAQITGIGRTTLFYWRRTEATPRAANISQVMRLHALVSLLVKRFGTSGAISWLRLADPERWHRLVQGDLTWVEGEVRNELMHQRTPLARSREVPSEPIYYEPTIAARTRAPRRAERKPVRRRLGESDR